MNTKAGGAPPHDEVSRADVGQVIIKGMNSKQQESKALWSVPDIVVPTACLSFAPYSSCGANNDRPHRSFGTQKVKKLLLMKSVHGRIKNKWIFESDHRYQLYFRGPCNNPT